MSPAAAKNRTANAGTPPVPGAKILVIDDEPGIHLVLGRALRASGFNVIDAGDGLEGVKLARAERPDLILCDIKMEKLDGFATINVLRLHPATANIPLILMTGHGNLDNMREGMSLGADDYLLKPFDIATLVKAVNLRLGKRKALSEESERRMAELRTSLSSMLPHELLTPLNGILGLADILANESVALSQDEVIELGRGIQASGVRLHHLINNFLLYAQVEMLKANPAPILAARASTRMDLAAVLFPLARHAAERWKRLPDLQLGPGEAWVAVSLDHLRVLLMEVLDNAFKFSEPGTPVSVAFINHGPQPGIIVRDAGRGMTAEQVAAIDAFVQFERRMHEQQGAGLGLVIVRGLAGLYGGSVKITSAPGKGTELRLCLPPASAEADAGPDAT